MNFPGITVIVRPLDENAETKLLDDLPVKEYNIALRAGGIVPMASPNRITLVLADDEPLARAGIRTMLVQAGDIDVVGEAEDGFEAQRLVAELHPRILLLDLKMPGPPPAVLEKWVRQHHPDTATLVLTAHHRQATLANMMEAGASGYLKKDIQAEALLDAIRMAAAGVIRFSLEQVAEADRWRKDVLEKWERLSEREREVLDLLALGASNAFIADELTINAKTVEAHVTRILEKLELDSRQKAIIWMMTHFPEGRPGRDD